MNKSVSEINKNNNKLTLWTSVSWNYVSVLTSTVSSEYGALKPGYACNFFWLILLQNRLLPSFPLPGSGKPK